MAEDFKPVFGAENIPEAGATDITLPDVEVEAQKPPAEPAKPPVSPPVPSQGPIASPVPAASAEDRASDLRAVGLPWDVIKQHVISPAPNDSILKSDVKSALEKPAEAAGTMPPAIRQAYADGIATGGTSGPDHFSGVYDEFGGPPIEDMAAQLPDPEKMVDQAQSILLDHEVPLTAEATRETKNNLADVWAQTGLTTDEVFAQTKDDPLLAQAVTLPQPPYQPTIEELERDKKDAINPFYTPFDYQAIVGFAKDFLSLPADQLAFRDKIQAMKDAGEDPAKIAEAERDNPALNFFVPMIALGVGAKGLHVAATAAAPKLTELFHDETGSIPLGPKPDIQGPKKPDESTLVEKPELTPGQKSALAKPQVEAQVDKVGEARPEPLPKLPPPADVDTKAYRTRLEDDLNRLRTNDTADKVAMVKLVDSLPEEWKDPAFLERASTEVETRLIRGAGAPLSPETQALLDAVKPLTDRRARLGILIKSKLTGREADDFEAGTPNEGMVRRSVIQNARGVNLLDPSAVQQDVITGGRPRSLSKYAPGVKGRTQYVFEHEETGARYFGTRPLDEIEHKMGDKVKGDGGSYTVKQATMEEVEASTKIRYNKNFLVNTIDDVLRMERVNRNLDLMAEHRAEMQRQGLFKPEKPGEVTGPPGMERVELPQMRGWADPKIAHILNDFYQDSTTRGSLLGFLARANRFLLSSLFISPVVHIGNVGAHWVPSRGWDWIKPAGYGSLVRDGYAAVNQVWSLGPRYIEHLREGSGLMYASTQTENFHQLLLNKLMNEMAADKNTWGSYAKSLGLKGVVDLTNAMYRQSRRALWMVNDMFLLQRQFELERKGLSTQDAIFQAEKDIPNYRVPNEVMKSHAVGELLRSPNFLNFGRYKYGQIRAIYLTVRDMIGPARTANERLEAAGKATILAAMAMGAYPLVNAGLQKLTGNPDAEVKPFGPLAVINAATGFATGQKNWVAALSSFMTLAPVLDVANKIRTNKDVWGRDIVSAKASPLGKMVEGLEGAATQFYPGQLLMDTLKNGPAKSAGNLVGLNLGRKPTAGQQAVWDKRDATIAKSREIKDPIESWVRGGLDLTPSAKKASTLPPTSTGGPR